MLIPSGRGSKGPEGRLHFCTKAVQVKDDQAGELILLLARVPVSLFTSLWYQCFDTINSNPSFRKWICSFLNFQVLLLWLGDNHVRVWAPCPLELSTYLERYGFSPDANREGGGGRSSKAQVLLCLWSKPVSPGQVLALPARARPRARQARHSPPV